MKLEVGDKGQLIGKELYSTLTLESDSEEEFVIAMRDSGFEFKYGDIWYQAKNGVLDKLKGNSEPLITETNSEARVDSQYAYRMYGLVPYNISPIQQGIQYGHAVVEYILEHVLDKVMSGEKIDLEKLKPLYRWAKVDKTFMIYNGGTTNNCDLVLGSLNEHTKTLINTFQIPVGVFHEPDLGGQLTATVFLVDERVWDEETYPNPPIRRDSDRNTVLSGRPSLAYSSAIDRMGGGEIWRLRQFLKQFKFA